MTNPLSVFPLGNKVGRRPSRLETSKGTEKPSLPSALPIRLLPEVASVLHCWPPTVAPSADMVADFLGMPWDSYTVSVDYRDAIETQLTLLLGSAAVGRLTVLADSSAVRWAPSSRPSLADRLRDDLRGSCRSFPWLPQGSAEDPSTCHVAWLALMKLSLQFWHAGNDALRIAEASPPRHQMRIRSRGEDPGTALEIAPDPRLHLSTGVGSFSRARATASPSWQIQFLTVNTAYVEVSGPQLVQELLDQLSASAAQNSLDAIRFWEQWCSGDLQQDVLHVSPKAALATYPGQLPAASRLEKHLCGVLHGLAHGGPVPRELLFQTLYVQGWGQTRFRRALDSAVLCGNARELVEGGNLLYDIRPDWTPESHDHYRRVHRIYGPHHALSPRALALEIEIAGQIEYLDLMRKVFPEHDTPRHTAISRAKHSASLSRARTALHFALELGLIQVERSGDRFLYRATPVETLRRLVGLLDISNADAMPGPTQSQDQANTSLLGCRPKAS